MTTFLTILFFVVFGIPSIIIAFETRAENLKPLYVAIFYAACGVFLLGAINTQDVFRLIVAVICGVLAAINFTNWRKGKH
jgi:hypothetical protein